jgi:hypothetical protein
LSPRWWAIYSIAWLSLRFRTAVLFTAVTSAFAGKMLVAVLLAKVLVRLHFWTDFLSGRFFRFRFLPSD